MVDSIASNSGKTFERNINCSYQLYTAYKNDRIIIDYGDNQSQNMQLNSSKILFNITNLKL